MKYSFFDKPVGGESANLNIVDPLTLVCSQIFAALKSDGPGEGVCAKSDKAAKSNAIAVNPVFANFFIVIKIHILFVNVKLIAE